MLGFLAAVLVALVGGQSLAAENKVELNEGLLVQTAPAPAPAGLPLISVDPRRPPTAVTAAPKPAAPEPGASEMLREAAATAKGANRLILEEVIRAAQGGGYSTARGASQRLITAFAPGEGRAFQPAYSKPSFCSSATYVVFVRVLGRLAKSLDAESQRRLLEALSVRGQVDGVDVWGRWNANGPGTAKLFYDAKIGRNFTEWNEAQAGDFAKLFWNDQIGVKERGHSVIYLGRETGPDGKVFVRFWSSNQPGGYGEKTVPLTAVKRVIFSRLNQGGRLGELAGLPETDKYLASLNRVATTASEVEALVDCKFP